MRRKVACIGLLFAVFAGWSLAQDTPSLHGYVLPGKVIDGDTVIIASIREVYIFPRKKFSSRREEYHYWKLVRDLKIVYPYARLAKAKLEELNREFMALPSDKARKAYAKQVEKQLRAEYEDQLKSLTITQGKLLIKLIDRETGNTTYNLVKELKGSFQAAFWQTVAVIFGSNLKVKYDANGKDAEIERILKKIELGYL